MFVEVVVVLHKYFLDNNPFQYNFELYSWLLMWIKIIQLIQILLIPSE